MLISSTFASAVETCETNPFVAALAEGIAHTDIGLTIATIILAIITFNLIDDRKQERIRYHWLHPFRHFHAEQDSVTDAANGDHTESHTEIDIDRD